LGKIAIFHARLTSFLLIRPAAASASGPRRALATQRLLAPETFARARVMLKEFEPPEKAVQME